jgi:hypothetical protein
MKKIEGNTASEWARLYGVSRQRIHQRLRDHGTVHPLAAACEVIDIAGHVYGVLRVLRRDHSRKCNSARWIVACKCGSAPFSALSNALRNGTTKRCITCSKAARDAKLVASDLTTTQSTTQ